MSFALSITIKSLKHRQCTKYKEIINAKKNIHILSVLSSALLASALKYAKLQFIDLRRFRVVAKVPITFATPVHMSIFPSVSLSVRPSVRMYQSGCHLLYFCEINPLNAELNPICCLLTLLGAHSFLHVSRIRVKSFTLRLLMSYIYMEHPFLMFLDHTQRRSTVGRTPLDE